MDAAQALADLTEISSQIQAAVLFDSAGSVRASTLDDEGRSSDFARRARELLDAAGEVRGGDPPTQLEAATHAGSVFVVRDGDTVIAATTSPEPTVGLVFYDLKTCLHSAERLQAEAGPKPKRRPAAKKTQGEGDGGGA